MYTVECTLYIQCIRRFYKEGVWHEIFDFRFFMNLGDLCHWGFHWGCFEFFREFAEIFLNECLSPVSMTPAIRCSPLSMTPVINPCLGFSLIVGVVDALEQLSLVLLSGCGRCLWMLLFMAIPITLSAAVSGDIIILVWGSLADLRGIWKRCVISLCMCLFMAVPITSSAGVSDLRSWRYCCLLTAGFLFLSSGSTVYRWCQRHRR